MSMFSHIRGMVRRAIMACSPSLIRDVEFERDNAVRQYLVTKNWALHYEMQAQNGWLLRFAITTCWTPRMLILLQKSWLLMPVQ